MPPAAGRLKTVVKRIGRSCVGAATGRGIGECPVVRRQPSDIEMARVGAPAGPPRVWLDREGQQTGQGEGAKRAEEIRRPAIDGRPPLRSERRR